MDSFSPAPLVLSGTFWHSGVPTPALHLKHYAKLDIVNNNIHIVKQKSPQPPG